MSSALQRGYWLKKLAGIEERASIGHSGGGRIGDAGEQEYRFTLPEEVVQGLKRVTGESVFLLYTALLSAVQINLYRYSGVSAVISGSPRREEEGEKAGPREPNLVAVVTEISGRLSFRECLLRVREGLLEAYKNQDYPLEALLRDRKQEEGSGLFELVVSMKGLHGEVGKRRISGVLMWEKEGEQIVGQWKYEQGWLSEGMIAEFSRQIVGVLKTGLANHQVQVREMEWMGAAEQRELVERWKGSEVESGGQTVVELIEEQVKRDGEAVAVVAAGEGIRYGELNERANQLGRYLRKQGVGVEVRVGLYMERGVELVIGILGIMKAGGVYVPLDPEYPGERLRYILKDSGARILLKGSVRAEVGEVGETGTVGEGLEGVAGVRQISIAAEKEAIASQSRENLEKEVEGENLVYVIYTSGSTGQPKGVGVTQAGLAERAMGLRREYGLKDRDRLLQFVSPSFDAFGEELFPVLISGGRVVMQREVKSLLPEELLQLVEREQITVLHCLKGFWTELERHIKQEGKQLGRSVRSLITGGETIYRSRAEKWIQTTGTEMWVAYGPTEATITATVYQWKAKEGPEEGSRNEEDRGVSLGRPVMNTRLYVVDEQWRVVPVGVAGELCIGGAAVARGYLGRAELTAEKFVPEPLQAGARMYRSGDLGRWNEWGELEFLGRKDRQVKIRGYRVELGEVEAALHGCEGVKEGVVIVGREEGESGSEQLVAYVAGGAGARLEGAELRTELEKRLPKHMVPGIVMVLPELPRTASGKVDQQKLPTPVRGEAAAEQRPRTQVEEILADIWRQVLKLEHVGIDQNFFELGGHSLLATRVTSKLQETFAVDLSMRAFFENPTVRALAAKVIQAKNRDCPPPMVVRKVVARSSPVPLSFAQERLWFLQQLQPESAFYNMPFAVRLRGDLHPEYVRGSVNEIVRRHEILRTSFPSVDGEPEQRIKSHFAVAFPLIDLSVLSLNDNERETVAKRLAGIEAKSPFNLETGPLLRATLVRFQLDDHLFLLTLHHAVADGWSMEIFTQEFAILYEGFLQKRKVQLPDLPLQYADFAIAQREWLQQPALGKQLEYWVKQLANAPKTLLLPDKVRVGLPSYEGAAVHFSVAAEPAACLRALCQAERVTMYMVLLAAYAVLLYRHSGQADIVVGSPIANRNHPGTENLIGLFVNQIALRCNLEGNPSFTELLKRIRETTLDAYVYQDFPFDKLVSALSLKRDLKQAPLYQVWFHFQQSGAVDDQKGLPGISPGYVSSEFSMAKLDLALFMHDTGTRLAGQLLYATDLFDPATILKMSEHLVSLLEAVAHHPGCCVLDLPLEDAGKKAFEDVHREYAPESGLADTVAN